MANRLDMDHYYSSGIRISILKQEKKGNLKIGASAFAKRVWIIDPKIFSNLLNSGRMQGTTAALALKAIFSVSQLRITMATPLEINGKLVYPGEDIPMYRICTVELQPSKREELTYGMIWRALKDEPTRTTGKSGGSAKSVWCPEDPWVGTSQTTASFVAYSWELIWESESRSLCIEPSPTPDLLHLK